MADSVLKDLTSSSLFDLTGVVAVVTGGGSVRLCQGKSNLNQCSRLPQGIGLMITTTLIANGATVYIIGPKKEDLDRCVLLPCARMIVVLTVRISRIAKVYNDVTEKANKPGRIHGIEGDVRKKVCLGIEGALVPFR